MLFTENDLDEFLNIYDSSFYSNDGGMKAPDMFTLYFTLKKIQPEIVIESGVWNGLSTKLIRKTLGPKVQIICLDPRNIPENGFIDTNPNTQYYTGNDFIDFGKLNLDGYDNMFAFFDDHQDAANRLLQCNSKNVKHVFFNDNYPKNCGSHFTIEHLFQDDTRHGKYDKDILNLIEKYHIFPNIYPGKIKTMEGEFSCESFLPKKEYEIFKLHQSAYRWNTYICLK
jgi:hypothetical protein